MYTGTNKAALCSQRHIASALVELLRTTPFSQISVSDVCRAARVSRQTFYSLFHTKENVLFFELERSYKFSVEESAACTGCDASMSDMCAWYSAYVEDNFEFIVLLVDNGLADILYQSLYRSMSCPACRHIPIDSARDVSAADHDLAAAFLAGALTGVTRRYIVRDQRDRAWLESQLRILLGA